MAAAIAGAVLLDLNKPAVELLGRSPFPPRVDAWHRAIQRERDTRGRLVGEVAAAAVSSVLAIGSVRVSRHGTRRTGRRLPARTNEDRS